MTEEASLQEECGCWTVPEHSIRIEYAQRVLTEIDGIVVDGFNRVRRGGVELGGVLFGVRDKLTVSILAFRPLSCEHALGPSFVLSKNDHAALAELLEGSRTDALLRGLVPVGWYHSHTRSHIHLTAQDIELFDRYFPESWQIALVLRPDSFARTKAGFFFRGEDGGIRAESSYREFLLPARFHAPPPPTTERPTRAQRVANKLAAAVTAPPPAAPAPSPSEVSVARRKAMPAVLVAVLTLALAWLWLALQRTAMSPHQRSALTQSPLSLTLEDQDGRLRIAWNRASRAILQNGSASLDIRDGGHAALLELDAEQLRSGTVLYSRVSGNVAVSMKVGGAEETAVFIGPVPPDRDAREVTREAADAPSKEPELPARIDGLNQIVDSLSREEDILSKSRATPKVFSPVVIARRPETPVSSLEAPPIENVSQPAPAPLIGNLPSPPPPPVRPPVPPAARASAAPRSGRLIWTGHLSKNGILTIVGNHASTGVLTGAIPGHRVRISVYPAKLTNDGLSVYSSSQRYPPGHAEAPSIHNGWNKASYFRDPRLAGALKALEEPNSNNGWKKLVLRNDGVNLSILLIEWDLP